MVIGMKTQFQSSKLGRLSTNLKSNKIEFADNATYIGLLAKEESCWDGCILELCKARLTTFNFFSDWMKYNVDQFDYKP